MLKLLSSSSTCLHTNLHTLPALRPGPTECTGPLLKALSSLGGLTRRSLNLGPRAFFCSDSSGDGSDQVVHIEVKATESDAEEVESKSSSAIVPTNPRPEDYLTVLALPLPYRPLFPGFYMPISIKDRKLLAALQESRTRQAPYAGAFLLKDEPGTDPSLVSGSESEQNIYGLKGKELLDRLHEVGTLAQISSIQGDQVILIGHRRLRITEMVNDDPLTVKVDHLKDKPYNKDDDVIKATSFEVISTLRDVLKSSSLWRDHVQTYTQVLALPLPYRPLFPGFYMPISIKDRKLLAALQESRTRQAPYAGAFLLKDEPGTDPSLVSGSESEQNIYGLKGKELLDRLHEVGTLAQISSIQGDQVILIGHRRLRITEMVNDDPLTVKVDHLKDKPYNKDDDVIKATSFEVISTLRDVLKSSSLWRDHVQTYTQHIGDFNFPRLADFGAAISGANKLQCQQVLEELDVYKRLKLTLELVKKEMEISKIQESIAKAIEEKISGEQRRYLLNEQLKAIKKELGLETDDKTALSAKFRERLEPNREKCPPHVLQVIEEELTKLQLLEASSSEFNVTRNYLDWLTALPWGNYSDENFDVLRAHKILDEDHYGLADVKERILEFIAVGKLRGTSQGKIICLSGPPGVGKTSIGRSIARALNRKFFRFSVGGLSDVAEIKGHRRTYIGAMPGKMVQCLKHVGTANPLVLIDEIDKLGRGHAGDPASAMLELLDPEQNANFLDHYLDVPIDLSKVLFFCTANVVEMIPSPLLDRMEVIAIAGYISDEKMHIARDYLEKTTWEACGIKPEQVEVTDAALLALIENYCREAGVRNLQKHIEKIYRKIALQLVRQGESNEPAIAGVQVVEPEEAQVERAEGSSLKVVGSETRSDPVEDCSHEQTTETSVEAGTMATDLLANQSQCPADQPSDSKDVTETKKIEECEATTTSEKVLVDALNLADYVGKPVFHAERIYDQTPVGVVMGLAWTAMGGSTLYIETTQVEQREGKGAIHLTGQLGDVMKESAQIAHTVARAILLEKKPDDPFFANSKLHLHVPSGATPKDGPSAGCTMITSLLSLAMKKPVKKDLAMTGEVTLTGKILPIGGVKEKTIAARRSEVRTIIFPSANRRDFDELAANVKEGLEVHFVDDYSHIFDLALGYDQNTGK